MIRLKRGDASFRFRHLFLGILSVCVGFGFYAISIPSIISLLAYNFFLRKRVVFTTRIIIILYLLVFSIGISLFVGTFDPENGESGSYSVYIFTIIVSMVTIVAMSSQRQAFLILICYSLGAFLNSMVTLLVSCILIDSYLCEYGKLYSIFDARIVNTPNYTNIVMPFLSLLVGYLFVYRPRFYSYKFWMPVLIFIFSAGMLSFLSSRAAYVSLFMMLVIAYLFGGRYRLYDIFYLLLIAILSYIGIVYLAGSGFADFEFLVERFSRSGLSTQRFERYLYGLYGLMETPVGTFKLPYEVANSNQVHNIYLDFAKYGGWVVFFFFFGFTMLGLANNPFKRDKYFKQVFIMYGVTWIVLQQDIFLGTGLPVLVSFVMAVTYLFVFSKQTKHDNQDKYNNQANRF